MPATPADVFARLAALSIATTTVEHEPLFSVEQSRKLRGEIPGRHCKSLFLKDKKGALWLVVAREDTAIDMKDLARRIGAARLSFASPELLHQVLGVTPGSVTPFALINDPDTQVRVVLEAAMMAEPLLNYHPLTNNATTTIANADLRRYIRACGHDPLVVALAN